jgi:hypothetical protein
VIFPGRPSREHFFPVSDGLEALRRLVARLEGTNEGVVVIGDVGVTSHFGDVLRRARVPSRVETREPGTSSAIRQAAEVAKSNSLSVDTRSEPEAPLTDPSHIPAEGSWPQRPRKLPPL